MKQGPELSPEESKCFLSFEYRELPGVVLVAPIAEEFVFRGYGGLMLDSLSPIYVALITSAAFALMHFKPLMILYSFFAGLIFFALFVFTENIALCMLAHATVNSAIWYWSRGEHRRLRALIPVER